MMELYILGPAEIRNAEGALEQSFLAGPKRLALLVFLLLSRPRGFHRRDSLLPLFWPEHGQKSARNALSNMLYHIRQTLGSEAILNRGAEEVMIRPEFFLSDAITFEEAIHKGELEKALKYYRAELLKGFYIADASPEFDQWLEGERSRFNSLASKAAWSLAEKAEEGGEFVAAQKWSLKAAAFHPLCEQTHTRLLKLLERSGDASTAMEVYQAFALRFKNEFEQEPAAEIKALLETIQRKEPITSRFKTISIKDSGATASGKEAQRQSIAVLPFETLGKDKATAFTDAIHGDILTRLSNLAALRVISRTSVMNFRNPGRLLPEIAAELGVEWILGGEVQEVHQGIQVHVRLVNAPEDRQVWAQSYRRELTADNLFQIQAEITRQITASLETRLTQQEEVDIKRKPTQDLESYCLHAQGRWSLDQRTEEGIRDSIMLFRQALSRDANYALAWVGLTDALILQYEYGYAPKEKTLEEAEKAAGRALILDPDLAEVHTSIALLHEARHQGTAAIRQFEKAIELRPNYADAHNWLSWTNQLLGRPKEALESAKRSVELNPLSLEALSNLSLSWLTNGEHEKALREARRIQHIQPQWTTGPFFEGLTLYHQGNYREAIRILENLSVEWAGSGPLITVALAYIGLGEKAKLRALQEQLTASADAFGLGLIHAALAEKEEAFREFNKIKEWSYWAVLSMHHFYPQALGPLRFDDRFDDLMRQLNFSWGIEDEKQIKEYQLVNTPPL